MKHRYFLGDEWEFVGFCRNGNSFSGIGYFFLLFLLFQAWKPFFVMNGLFLCVLPLLYHYLISSLQASLLSAVDCFSASYPFPFRLFVKFFCLASPQVSNYPHLSVPAILPIFQTLYPLKCRLKAGNSCYYSVQTLLSS